MGLACNRAHFVKSDLGRGKQSHAACPFLYAAQLRIDFKNMRPRKKKKNNYSIRGKKKNRITSCCLPTYTPLLHPPLTKVPPAEVVARLLEHEALTALPEANFNLFHWNGMEREMSGEFLIVYSLIS